MPRKKTVETIMARAIQTRASRKKIYGGTHIRHGAVMAALFPKGVTLRSSEEFARFGVLNMVVSKVCRYTARGIVGHPDSAHDLIVYGALLEERT